jgi:hypothetical protein
MKLTPSERTLRARIAAHELHAKGRTNTKAATEASPARATYFERQVDPNGTLSPRERARRAEHLRQAHFTRLALLSAKARREQKCRS